MSIEEWIKISDRTIVRASSIYMVSWSKRGDDWMIRLEFLNGVDESYVNVQHGFEGPFIPLLGPKPD